ncbi:MAG: trypsin-like serine protease [Gemmataceae bacterium]|nr:trypsin-like serine protease [Gemmataceae bacterium]
MPAVPVPAPRKYSPQWVGDEAKLPRPAESRGQPGAPPVSVRVARPKSAAPAAKTAAPAGVRGEAEFGPVPSGVTAEAAAADAGPALDAWHASYTDSVSLVALKKSGDNAAQAFAPELVFADDDRRRVTNTRDFPWRCICSLEITAANGTRWVGTGWLAGPRTVITAGHCVYLHRHGGWARQVVVYPGRNGADTSLGRYVSDDLRSVTGWTDGKNPAYDYGAILLPEPLDLGWLAYAVYPDADLRGLVVNVFGYPADKPAGELWGAARVLQQVLPQKLVYNLSTFGGQSGAPVFEKAGAERVAVGIHNYGDVSGNSATRITDGVYDDITAWKE